MYRSVPGPSNDERPPTRAWTSSFRRATDHPPRSRTSSCSSRPSRSARYRSDGPPVTFTTRSGRYIAARARISTTIPISNDRVVGAIATSSPRIASASAPAASHPPPCRRTCFTSCHHVATATTMTTTPSATSSSVWPGSEGGKVGIRTSIGHPGERCNARDTAPALRAGARVARNQVRWPPWTPRPSSSSARPSSSRSWTTTSPSSPRPSPTGSCSRSSRSRSSSRRSPASARSARPPDPSGEIIGSLSDNLPPDIAEQIRPQLDAVLGQIAPGLLSIGAVLALWAAMGGIGRS